MEKICFKCLRCDSCCVNLFKEEFGITNGLALSKDEAKLFPPENISPSKGLGIGPKGPRIIVSYQLNVETCPHLKDGECNIYDSRPLVCRVFPLISFGPMGTSLAHPDECLFVKKLEEEIGSSRKILPLTQKKFKAPVAWNALSRMNARGHDSFSTNPDDVRTLWSFDLKDNEWKIMAAY